MEAERLAAEVRAQSEEGEEESGVAGTPFMKTVVWIVVIVVIVGLGFACSGPDDDGGSSGSARSSFHGGSHGGK